MQVEFVGQSMRDADLPQSSTGRLLNLYREPIDGRSPWVLRSVPGQTEAADLTGTGSYAMAANRNRLLIAHSGGLWRMSEGGEFSELASGLPEDDNTRIDSAFDATAPATSVAVMTAQGRYFVWNGLTNTFSEPAAGAFSEFGDVAFFGQRVILSEKGGRRIQWGAVGDPTSLGGLDFATAETYDDDILRLIAVGGALWVLKERSIERWYAAADGPRYIPGSATSIGLKAWGLVTALPDGVFWIGTDGKAHLSISGSEQIVSTVAVNTAIERGQALRCVYYRDGGHEMLCIIFGDRPAWCFDMSTQEWHERAEGDDFDAWDCRAIALAPWGGFYAVNRNGSIALLERTNMDRGDHMPRRATGRTVENEGARFRVADMRFRANVGRFATAPDMLLRVSKDYGQTWGDWKSRTLGNIGKYRTVLEYRALGQFEAFTPEIALWGPEDVAIEATAFMRIA